MNDGNVAIAYQIFAGLDIRLTDMMGIVVQYRAIGTSDAEYSFGEGNFVASNFEAGLRFSF